MQPGSNPNPNPQPPIWQQPPPLYPAPPAPPTDEPQLPEPQAQGPEPVYPEATPKPRLSRKRVLKIIGAIAGVLLLLFLAYNLFIKSDGVTTGSQTGNLQLSEMGNLNGASLLPPTDLGRYQSSPTNSATNMHYATSEGDCKLDMGVASRERLPGKDYDALVGLHLKKYRDNNMKVDGPKEGAQLQLLDATDSTKGYTLPTVTYTASDDATHISGRYSVAILKKGERVYVIRTCETKDKPANTEQLDKIDEDVATVGVVAE